MHWSGSVRLVAKSHLSFKTSLKSNPAASKTFFKFPFTALNSEKHSSESLPTSSKYLLVNLLISG